MEIVGRMSKSEMNALYRQQVVKVEAFEFPLYGIDKTWRGSRYPDGPRESSSVDPATGKILMTRVECALVHGDADKPDAPYLRVATTTDPDATLPWRLVVRVEPTPFEERIQAIADVDHIPPGATRSTVTITIDGRSTEFDLLQRGPYLVARHHTEHYDIILEGREFDLSKLALVTVKDLRSYIEGFWARH